MSRVVFTLRIDEKERSALENLSKVERQPVNKLVNEAIKSYLHRKGQKEGALEKRLARLEEYRKQDPGYRRAFDAFIEAEATLKDPVEGEPFEEPDAKPSTPVQKKVREILGA
jgi:predicted transcriptional regulator